MQYVQDLIFAPIDQKGKKIDPPPSSTNNNDKVNSIKVVDVLLSVRSKNEFLGIKNLGLNNPWVIQEEISGQITTIDLKEKQY